jgi:hypothetical protein
LGRVTFPEDLLSPKMQDSTRQDRLLHHPPSRINPRCLTSWLRIQKSHFVVIHPDIFCLSSWAQMSGKLARLHRQRARERKHAPGLFSAAEAEIVREELRRWRRRGDLLLASPIGTDVVGLCRERRSINT